MATRVFPFIRMAAAAAALAILVTAPFARTATADSFDERTAITFANSVQIPGQVLPAGRYVFKLSPVPLERDLVQIINADQNRVIATLFTIPVWFEHPAKRSMVRLSESLAGSPPAVHQMVYAGSSRGHEFVY